ncbi:MAG: 30S ribosomal protein S13 [Lentisphaeraceae bacterium]|nr:30S ribosomal protein S13 [Lentisphaeraceae bacterium]
MQRILGVDIPSKKKVSVALTYIFGIGPSTAQEIVEKIGVSPDTKADDLTPGHVAQITKLLDGTYEVEGDLRRQLTLSIRRLQSIGCYRGVRHRRGLPCRGQRTKTNARTRKGKKRTVGAIRDKAARKGAK